MINKKLSTCLWFDNQAEEAAGFYTGIFKNSAIRKITRFGKEGQEIHGKEEGSVMTVSFSLEGSEFLALNGGPLFKFNESVSVVIHCETQEEVDYYWSSLCKDGEESQCGWLKDKFGLSWQVVPLALLKMLESTDEFKKGRMTEAMLKMQKLDIDKLQNAFDGRT